MDEKPDQILGHIASQRSQLGSNLSELENRVRHTTDWRTHFDNNPLMMMAAAMGGGMLLGSMVAGGRRRSSWSSSRYSGSAGYYSGTGAKGSSVEKTPGPATSYQKQRASETIDNIKAAMIGFATAKAKEFLNQALPGFDQHLTETEQRSGSAGQHGYPSQAGEPHVHGTQEHSHPHGNEPHTHPGQPPSSTGRTQGWQTSRPETVGTPS